MPVDVPGVNHFSKAVALLVAREANQAGDFGRRKSLRALPEPREAPSQTPTSRPIHVPAGTEEIARWLPAYRRHRNTLRNCTR